MSLAHTHTLSDKPTKTSFFCLQKRKQNITYSYCTELKNEFVSNSPCHELLLFLLGIHFSQELYGRARSRNKTPAIISKVPAHPIHTADHDSSWCSGMEWSLANNERTDWWKTMRDRNTRRPDFIWEVKKKEKKLVSLLFFSITNLEKQNLMKIKILNKK